MWTMDFNSINKNIEVSIMKLKLILLERIKAKTLYFIGLIINIALLLLKYLQQEIGLLQKSN